MTTNSIGFLRKLAPKSLRTTMLMPNPLLAMLQLLRARILKRASKKVSSKSVRKTEPNLVSKLSTVSKMAV